MAKKDKAGEGPKPKPRPGEGERGRTGRPTDLDHIKFQLICEELARTGSKYKSCEALGFNYHTVSGTIRELELKGDDSWREAWDTAYDQYRDSLEVEATRRARDGVVTEWTMGINAEGKRAMVPKRVEYSDRLMEVLLKGAFPERFRERISLSGQIGLEPVDAFSNLTSKAKREIRSIIMRDLEEQRQAAAAKELEQAGDAPGAVIEGTAVERALADMRGSSADK